MLEKASTNSAGAFSVSRAVVAGTWSGCAFALAQLAEGYSVNIFFTIVFGALVGLSGGQLRTTIGFGSFLMSSIALGAVVVSSIGFGTSLNQFFPDVWGPIDLMIALLLWLSPVMAILVTRCESKVNRWMFLVLSSITQVQPTLPPIDTYKKVLPYFELKYICSTEVFDRQSPRRGPPSFVVA